MSIDLRKPGQPYAARVEVAPFDPEVMRMPWIARIDAWETQAPRLSFGGYTRNDWDDLSTGGVLEVAASPGDLVRWGQRSRTREPGIMAHGIVLPDYTVQELTTGEAHKAWRDPARKAERDGAAQIAELAGRVVSHMESLHWDVGLEPDEVADVNALAKALGAAVELDDAPW